MVNHVIRNKQDNMYIIDLQRVTPRMGEATRFISFDAAEAVRKTLFRPAQWESIPTLDSLGDELFSYMM